MKSTVCIDLKDQLARNLAKKIDDEMEKLWINGKLNAKKLEELRKAHMRTPYK